MVVTSKVALCVLWLRLLLSTIDSCGVMREVMALITLEFDALLFSADFSSCAVIG